MAIVIVYLTASESAKVLEPICLVEVNAYNTYEIKFIIICCKITYAGVYAWQVDLSKI